MAINSHAAGVLQLSDNNSAGSTIGPEEHTFTGRNQEKQGADVVAINLLTLGDDGNYFRITGATQVQRINRTGWQAGSVITLLIPVGGSISTASGDSGVFAGINLAGTVTPIAMSNGATVTLRLDDDGSGNFTWFEIGRALLPDLT